MNKPLLVFAMKEESQDVFDAYDVLHSGIGKVSYGGAAEDLEASISGLGSIRVKEVTGSVSKSVSGDGSVRVGDGPS